MNMTNEMTNETELQTLNLLELNAIWQALQQCLETTPDSKPKTRDTLRNAVAKIENMTKEL